MKKIVLFIIVFMFVACENGTITPENFNPDLPRLFLGGQSNASPELVEAIRTAGADQLYIAGQNWPGKSIKNWINYGIPQSQLKSDYDFIRQFPKPHYLLWFQGESDRDRPKKWKTDFQDMRAWYNARMPNLKFIILEVYTTNTDENGINNLTGIRHQQEILARDSARIYLIDTALYDRKDPTHLSAQGQADLAIEVVNFINGL